MRLRRLAMLGVVCLALLALLYVIAVHTDWGQRLDNAALAGRTTRPSVLRATDRLLNTISVSSIVLGGAAIALIAVARRRLHLALTAAAVMLGADVTTQVLKYEVLSRPVLAHPDPLGPSFPSGHSTVAMSLAVALVLVVPARARGLAALGGLGYACLVGAGTVTAGWHRPSDVMAAYLVAVGWGAGAAAGLVLWRGATGSREPRPLPVPLVPPVLATAGLGLLLVGFVGFAGTVVALRQDRLGAVHLGGAYAAALAAIVGTGLCLLAALLAGLRGVTLDPPAVIRPAAPRGTGLRPPSLR